MQWTYTQPMDKSKYPKVSYVLISQNKIGTINRNEELNLNFCYKKDLKKFSLEDLTGKSNIEALYYLESNGIKADIKSAFFKCLHPFFIIEILAPGIIDGTFSIHI